MNYQDEYESFRPTQRPPERCEIGSPLVPTESIRSFLHPNDQESRDLIRNRASGISRHGIPHHPT